MHALATKSIKGLPSSRSILHVKQQVLRDASARSIGEVNQYTPPWFVCGQVLGDSRPPLRWLMEANGKIAALRDRITDLDRAIKVSITPLLDRKLRMYFHIHRVQFYCYIHAWRMRQP